MKEKLVEMIMEVAEELNAEQEIEIGEKLQVDTPLFGEEGLLDSMGLVSLIIAVEQAIEERMDAQVSLADEKALSQANSPYRSIDSLAEYAANELTSQVDG